MSNDIHSFGLLVFVQCKKTGGAQRDLPTASPLIGTICRDLRYHLASFADHRRIGSDYFDVSKQSRQREREGSGSCVAGVRSRPTFPRKHTCILDLAQLHTHTEDPGDEP